MKKRPPSVTILTNMIKEGWVEKYGSSAWAVYNVLFAFADWHTGGNCYPSYKKIHELTGLASQTICNALKLLEEADEITVQRHNPLLKHRQNNYTVNRIAP